MQQQYPVVEFTVELARQLLVDNKINRKIKPRLVERYAEAMASNNWEFTGGTIVTDNAGVLLDGQHRLLAIIKSGKPQKFIMIGNLPRTIFDVLDTGAARKAADVIHQVGEYQSSSMVASAAKYLAVYETTGSWARPAVGITNKMILRTASRHEDLGLRQKELAGWIYGSGIRGLRRGVVLALYITMLQKDLVLAESFFRKVFVGEEIAKTDIEFMLRRRLLNGAYEEKVTIGLIIKAWNAKRKGLTLPRLGFQPDEKIPEIF